MRGRSCAIQSRVPQLQAAWRRALFFLSALTTIAFYNAAVARELGVGDNYQPGLSLGIPTGAAPPTGIYQIGRLNYYSAHVVDAMGARTGTTVDVTAFSSQVILVPGWEFLGARYSAFINQPYVQLWTKAAGVESTTRGIANTTWSLFNLSWALGSDWFATAGFTFYAPNGYITGLNGTAGIGAPFWTFEPGVALSYLGHGWNLSATVVYDTNTTNPYDRYHSGDQLFVDLTATKKFGNFEIGPVAYFTRQVTPDSDPHGVYANLAALGVPGIDSAPTAFAPGGLLAYNFGAGRLLVYATHDVYARDTTQGWKLWADLNFPLWSAK
jgi:hypothetical protein